MKKVLSLSIKNKRLYSQTEHLVKLGRYLDQVLENREAKNTEFGKYFYSPKKLNYNDPKEVLRWIKLAAKEGPDVILGNKEQPPAFVISITGAAGQIAYNLIPRICAGEMFGPNQKVILHLIEVEEAMKSLEAIQMELQDCAFPLLEKLVITSDYDEGFKNADFAILIGGKPRKPGQERKDMLKENAQSFVDTGKAINRNVKTNCNILVVANPANTNAMVLSENAPYINPRLVTALTRLDHDRGLGMIAQKAGCSIQDVDRFAIWGNHSNTQCPDFNNVTIKGKWIRDVIKDEEFFKNLVPTLQQRGAAVLASRGKSSAASAASSIMSHFRDLLYSSNRWQSMAVRGNGQYGIPNYLWCSYPVVTKNIDYEIVDRIEFTPEVATQINKSIKELNEERDAVKHLLPDKFYSYTKLSKNVFSWRYLVDDTSPQLIQFIFNNDKVFNDLKAFVASKVGEKWESFKEFVKENSKWEFKDIEPFVQGTDINENDLRSLQRAVFRSVEYEYSVLKCKQEMFLLDLEEHSSRDYYQQLKTKEEKIKYHLKTLLSDGELSREGLNTVGLLEQFVKQHIK